MGVHRLWQDGDGSVKIEVFIDGASPDDMARTAANQKEEGRLHPDATFIDFGSREALLAVLPPDRSKRDIWIVAVDKGGKVVVKAKSDVIASDAQPASLDGLVIS